VDVTQAVTHLLDTLETITHPPHATDRSPATPDRNPTDGCIGDGTVP
jgi:hypothetical protein